nr:sulfite exporter TauE/SafE family protein [Armatimonas sp.]
MPTLALWQWALLAFGAFSVGVSKTGVPGLGIVSVVIFTLLLPTKFSVGAALLVLICADLLAVAVHRKNGDVKQILRLLPWSVVGIALGALFLNRMDDRLLKPVLGAVLFAICLTGIWRSQQKDVPKVPAWAAPLAGLAAGFTTMIANAAGPVTTLYLLAMRLPKEAFLGTAAVYFFLINWIKVPFSIFLSHNIEWDSLRFAAWLFPYAILGGLVGKPLSERISQQRFEQLALALTALGSLWMLVRSLIP